MELLVFQRTLNDWNGKLGEGTAIYVRGRISVRDEKDPQLMVEDICLLEGDAMPHFADRGGFERRRSPAPPPPPPREAEAPKGRTLWVKLPSQECPAQAHPHHVRGPGGGPGDPAPLLHGHEKAAHLPLLAPPLPGAGAEGDAGRGSCGHEMTEGDKSAGNARRIPGALCYAVTSKRCSSPACTPDSAPASGSKPCCGRRGSHRPSFHNPNPWRNSGRKFSNPRCRTGSRLQ